MKLLLPLLLAPQILWADSYKVRPLAKGETISDILYNDNYKPLYGENEWVEKVLKLNRLTETQAKNLDPETLLIVPTRNVDSIKIKQSSVLKSGILTNKIPENHVFKIGFAIHHAQSSVDTQKVISNENFGITLSYTDNQSHSWNGANFTPTYEFTFQGHGANQSDRETIATYENTYRFNSRLGFKSEKGLDYGPTISLEQASRSTQSDNELTIRRDTTTFIGAFASYRFNPVEEIELNMDTTLQRTVVETNSENLNSLNAIRADLKISTLITTHTEAHIFSQYEVYENANLDTRLSTGAGFTYLIK